ncbi:hypothetical protein AAFF_G00055580 [Aldrovandia affinis]|uniref:Uncharacterized protein n=1 Tax=Aldrovandia affinis TaxID=143900 RepID=A0AAD7S0R1_9TELE|nr:hypothetical protein AAFF_G00055580 [Aldrovandia affinis]
MWLKSSSKKEWATVDADLIKILDGVKGTVEKKLEKIGDLIYVYGAERFRTKQTGKKDMTPTIPPKSRRQQEIQRLVKQRRDLRKQWKRASVEERAGIDLLQTDLKGRLGRLRRAENLRTRRKRKERARTTFYKDPFRFVKGLFTKEKSGHLSNIGLYGHGALELPVSSLTEEYKCTKVRLNMTLTESQDGMIQAAAPRLATGRKWMPSEAVQQAKSALRHGDIVGQVQHGRGGFGLGASRPTWHKATSTQRRKLVVSQVRHQEEADRCAKAVSQSKQGQWTSWENLEHRKLTWKDLWEMEGRQISFIIRATYDVLPTPKNLHQWFGEDPSCALCQTLQH